VEVVVAGDAVVVAAGGAEEGDADVCLNLRGMVEI